MIIILYNLDSNNLYVILSLGRPIPYDGLQKTACRIVLVQ